MSEIKNIHFHCFSDGHIWIIPFTTNNPRKKEQLYRAWARNESIKWQFIVLNQLLETLI